MKTPKSHFPHNHAKEKPTNGKAVRTLTDRHMHRDGNYLGAWTDGRTDKRTDR